MSGAQAQAPSGWVSRNHHQGGGALNETKLYAETSCVSDAKAGLHPARLDDGVHKRGAALGVAKNLKSPELAYPANTKKAAGK